MYWNPVPFCVTVSKAKLLTNGDTLVTIEDPEIAKFVVSEIEIVPEKDDRSLIVTATVATWVPTALLAGSSGRDGVIESDTGTGPETGPVEGFCHQFPVQTRQVLSVKR